MKQNVSNCCPKCNNFAELYRYGKTLDGYQKYQCRICKFQFAPDRPKSVRQIDLSNRKYPPCPKCGKASFLHHDYPQYSNYRCGDKKCYHSFFVHKAVGIAPASSSKLFGKTDFKRMRFPLRMVQFAILQYYFCQTSFRKIAWFAKEMFNIEVSHQSISDWCKKFAPLLQNIQTELISACDFNSDEWHADETVIKIKGKKYWVWFVIDSETRFVLGFHLTPFRDSEQAFTTFDNVKDLGKPNSVVTDRLPSYNKAIKAVLGANHIKVGSFYDDITNNLDERFNGTFKDWYRTKRAFNSFESANNMIACFVFFYNFKRPHSGLNGLTPAQVAGLKLTAKQKRKYWGFVA